MFKFMLFDFLSMSSPLSSFAIVFEKFAMIYSAHSIVNATLHLQKARMGKFILRTSHARMLNFLSVLRTRMCENSERID